LAHVHLDVGILLLHQVALFERPEQLADARRGEHLVFHARQRRELLGPRLGPLRPQVHALVPREHGNRGIDDGDLAKGFEELLVGLWRGHDDDWTRANEAWQAHQPHSLAMYSGVPMYSWEVEGQGRGASVAERG